MIFIGVGDYCVICTRNVFSCLLSLALSLACRRMLFETGPPCPCGQQSEQWGVANLGGNENGVHYQGMPVPWSLLV